MTSLACHVIFDFTLSLRCFYIPNGFFIVIEYKYVCSLLGIFLTLPTAPRSLSYFLFLTFT